MTYRICRSVESTPTPYVESRQETCVVCDTLCWVSINAAEAKILCSVCGRRAIENTATPAKTDEATRKELRERGWSDKEIDKEMERFNKEIGFGT